jgi:hypothetical protein
MRIYAFTLYAREKQEQRWFTPTLCEPESVGKLCPYKYHNKTN